MKEMSNLEGTLKERGSNYGDFADHAAICQTMKVTLASHPNWNRKLSSSQRESLEMILHKIARIVNGDPNYIDSWTDIAGYATLIEKELTTKE